jgi:4a-hydroxytetrahydrobiopterin dehydratase
MDWILTDKNITKTFEFADFNTAIAFVSKVAQLSEAENHHPDIDIRWNKVTLTLTTHDAGGVTDKDHNLAEKISALMR